VASMPMGSPDGGGPRAAPVMPRGTEATKHGH
jgi:hypothetical protein